MKKFLIALVLVAALGGCMAALSNGDNGSGSGTASVTTVADAPDSSTPKTTKPKPATSFGEGVYKVGTDIKPGLYKSENGGYYARLRSSDTTDIIANDLKDSGTMYVTVKSTDAYVDFNGGPWVMVK